MKEKHDEIIQSIDERIALIDLNGRNIIDDCRTMIHFIGEKKVEMKDFFLSHPFETEADEIYFFKHQKPMLLGRLFYFYKILRIESLRPVDDTDLDGYYKKQQEELKVFFHHHLSFFQYYRSGGSTRDKHCFLHGRQNDIIDVDICQFDDDPEFSTGYDHLVARLVSMEMIHSFLSFRRTCLQNGDDGALINLLKMRDSFRWTGSIVELVELAYALDGVKCINNGEVTIQELTAFLGTLFGLEIKDCYSAYVDIKKRKEDSRTYFLDKMRDGLVKRMEQDEVKDKKRK